MRGFKVVVRLDDGRRVSAFAGTMTGILSGRRVTYEAGGWTYPQRGDGPLGVFTSLRWAERFIGANPEMRLRGTVEIWSVEYIPSPFDGFWCHDDKRSDGRINKLWDVPEGTDFADSVMLDRKVMRGEDNGEMACV